MCNIYIIRRQPCCPAKVLSQYVAGIAVRAARHDQLEAFAKHADVPVINYSFRSAAPLGNSISVLTSAKAADVIYTDVWASMGQEVSAQKRRNIFQPYQVNQELMRLVRSEVVFLHCLPALRGEKVVAQVMDGPQSLAWKAAENALHVQQAVIALLL